MKYSIVTQNKPFSNVHEGVQIDISYDMLLHSKPESDGSIKMIGWWPDKPKFDNPIYLKPVSVEEYILDGNGD